MTTIRLDAATADQLRRADGRVLFCDPDGHPVRTGLVFGPDPLDREPDLTPDEWRRRGEQFDAEPRIRKTPDVIGGEACIRRTRIAVFMLVESKQIGSTDVDLLNSFPTLSQQDLDAAWAYYATNRDEIEAAIRRHNSDEDE